MRRAPYMIGDFFTGSGQISVFKTNAMGTLQLTVVGQIPTPGTRAHENL